MNQSESRRRTDGWVAALRRRPLVRRLVAMFSEARPVAARIAEDRAAPPRLIADRFARQRFFLIRWTASRFAGSLFRSDRFARSAAAPRRFGGGVAIRRRSAGNRLLAKQKLKGEKGQLIIEYVLLLLVSVVIALALLKLIKTPAGAEGPVIELWIEMLKFIGEDIST